MNCEGGIETIRQGQTRLLNVIVPFVLAVVPSLPGKILTVSFLQGEHLILICVEQHGNGIEGTNYGIVCPLPFIRGVSSHLDEGCIMLSQK